MIKTFLETKRYTKDDNDYFWIKNVDFKQTELGFFVWNMSSNPEYSYDKVTWHDKTEDDGWWRIYLNPGQKVYLRNDGGYWNDYQNKMNVFQFGIERLSVGGPIASLIDYTDLDNVTSVPDYCFSGLFSGNSQTGDATSGDRWYDASQIDFGNITSVGVYAMNEMFYNCKNLKSAPDLSGITSVDTYGLGYMFRQCYNLSKVTAPNVSDWDTSATPDWLYGAGEYLPAGTVKEIHCPTGLVIPTDDYSGIPSGWTRIDY